MTYARPVYWCEQGYGGSGMLYGNCVGRGNIDSIIRSSSDSCTESNRLEAGRYLGELAVMSGCVGLAAKASVTWELFRVSVSAISVDASQVSLRKGS
jgi:hypothetical protein